MKIYGAQQGIPEGSAREKLNTAKEMIDHSIQDLRNISHSLNSEWVKKQGLSQAIIKHLEQITERDGMKFNVEVNGDDSLAPEQEVVVFRIVQEAVKNTLTHAQATEINFDISYEHDIFRLEIIDNGIGFNADLTNDSTGIGLTNMQERARILGGEMHFNTKPGEGTKIVLTINQSKA
ncbi:MAG: hypothetical protein EOO01_34470 [Chitinophagaceae bacterium]|nr:MAG: hypothetical protein EOO01_34470 [Chitinophagaceae bacterium]